MLDFSEVLQKRTEDFSGRQWVFEQIDAWLSNPQGKRFFVLSGEPGSGKSAIAARLAQISLGQAPPFGKHLKPGFLAYSHFCEYNRSASINPLRFTESLSEALSECYPAFREALLRIQARQSQTTVEQKAELDIETIEAGAKISVNTAQLYISSLDARPVFDQYVHQPLEAAFSREVFGRDGAQPVVVLVDSLNEAALFGQGDGEGEAGKAAERGENIVDLLARNEGLPKNVLFLLTSRPDKPLLARFKGAVKLSLELKKYVKRNDRDIAGYIRERLESDPRLAEKTASRPKEVVEAFIDRLTRQAQGNFLYTTFLMKAIALGDLDPERLYGLPGDLPALYKDFLDTALARQSAAWDIGYAQIAGILAVAQDSLTPAQLRAFSGQAEPLLKRSLEALRQFLEETVEAEETGQPVLRYRLYHQSMAEFFQVKSIRVEDEWIENPYPVNVAESHAAIVRHYRGKAETWAEVSWKEVDDYGLQYLAAHLFSLRDQPEFALQLYGLVNPNFRQAKLERFYSHQLFAQDVNLAVQVCQERQPVDLPQLIRLCLTYGGLVLSRSVTPPEVLAALAGLGELPRALGMAALQSSQAERYEAYLTIGQALLSQGQAEQAQMVFEKAVEAAGQTDSPSDRDEALQHLAQALAAQGQLEQAQQTYEQIENRWIGQQARVAAAIELAKAGLNEAALRLAGEGDHDLYTAHGQVLDAIAASQGLPAAVQAADQIPEPQKGAALNTLAQSRLKNGQLDQALSLAAALADPGARDGLYAALAARLAEGGQAELAWETAGKIAWEYSRGIVRGEVLAVTARRQGLEAAEALIAGLDPGEKDGALGGLAEALAEAGELDQAAATLHAIGDGFKKGQAFQGCAERLVRHGRAEAIAGLADRLPEADERDEALGRAMFVLLQNDLETAALGLSSRIESPSRRQVERSGALLRLAENEGLPRAREWAAALPEKEEQDRAWGGLAEQMAQSGWRTQASELLQYINDPDVLAESFRWLLSVFKARQDWPAALELLQAAPTALREKIAAESEEQAIQGDMQAARAAASGDGWEAAWTAIDQMATTYERLEARQALLLTLARQGDIPAASQAVNSRFHLPEDQHPLEQLFEALAYTGLGERGMAIIARLETPALRLAAAAALLSALARRSPSDALQLLETFPNPDESETFTRQAAQNLYFSGRLRQALRLAVQSGDRALADELMANAVRHTLRTGDIPRAYAISQEINDEAQRARSQIEVLGCAARAGGLQGVIDLSGLSPEQHAGDFIRLVEEVLRDAPPGGPEEAFAQEAAERLPGQSPPGRFPYESSQDRVWEVLGNFYLRHGRVEPALEAARRIGAGGNGQSLFIGLVKQLVRRERSQEAIDLCGKASAVQQSVLLAHTALEMSRRGQSSQARGLVERLFQMSGQGYQSRLANRALARLVDCFRRAGDLERAAEIAGVIQPGDLEAVNAWIDLAWDWLERKAVEPARTALSTAQQAIESLPVHEDANWEYAQLALLAGSLEGLRGLEQYVQALMENKLENWNPGEMLYYLARQVARPAWAERVSRIRGAPGLPGLRQAALLISAKRWQHAVVGLLEQSQRRLPGPGSQPRYWLTDSLSYLGLAWLEAGKPQQALEAVEWTLSAPWQAALLLNDPTLRSIRIMRRAGRQAEASELLRQLVETALNAGTISRETNLRIWGEAARLCLQWGETELYGRLMQSFKRYSNPQTLLYALADLAEGLVEDGALERAREVADLAWEKALDDDSQVALPFSLRYTLPSALQIRLAAGQPERIGEILERAERVPEASDRAQTQASLAEILSKAERDDQALPLAEAAWAAAQKDPSAFRYGGYYEVARVCALVFGWKDPPRGLAVIETVLPMARLTGSSEVLSEVDAAISIMEAAGQRDTLWRIFEALRELGSW